MDFFSIHFVMVSFMHNHPLVNRDLIQYPQGSFFLRQDTGKARASDLLPLLFDFLPK